MEERMIAGKNSTSQSENFYPAVPNVYVSGNRDFGGAAIGQNVRSVIHSSKTVPMHRDEIPDLSLRLTG